MPSDVWASGAAYEQYVGRWSRPVAVQFLAWLGLPGRAVWLDVGCGTGAVSETILTRHHPALVAGIDGSAAYARDARRRLRGSNAAFASGNAEALPVRSGAFDAAVSGLVLNFVPRPEAALAEMARAVRPGGLVAVYVWDYAGRMELMRAFWDAAVALDPAAATLDEGRRFPICQPDRLEDLFRTAGLAKVESRAIDIPTRFERFEDYWTPFLGGQGPAPGYVTALEEERRVELRERLRSTLPVRADGSIELTARAWAAKGISRSAIG